jgi:hypothetical protein
MRPAVFRASMSGALDQRCKVPRRFAEFAGRDVLVERRQRVGDSRRAAACSAADKSL